MPLTAGLEPRRTRSGLPAPWTEPCAGTESLAITRCHPMVLERFYLAEPAGLIDIAVLGRSKSCHGRQAGWLSSGLRPLSFSSRSAPDRARKRLRSRHGHPRQGALIAGLDPPSPGLRTCPPRPSPSPAGRAAIPRRRLDAFEAGRRAMGRAQRRLAESKPAWRHGRASACPRQLRRDPHHPRECRDLRQSLGRRRTGFRSGRAHHRDPANGYGEGVRSQGRHAQRERSPILGRKPQRRQSHGPADPDRHRRARRRPALGAVVSAEILRQIRHQDRRAEPRRGIHHQPDREHILRQ